MLFTASFLTVLLSVSAVEFNVNKAVKNPFMNKNWASMKPSVSNNNKAVLSSETDKSTSTPTFLISTLHDSAQSCDGPVRLIVGTGFNYCMVGMDDNGKIVGSIKNSFTSEDATYINYVSIAYNSSDCTGNSEMSSATIPKQCQPSYDKYSMSYATSTERFPWVTLPLGYVQQ